MERPTRSGTVEGMDDFFKKATIDLAILFLLQERPMYSYELVQEINQRSGYAYVVNNLYMTVSKLQRHEYIEEYKKEVSESTRLRKYYCITEQGREYYERLGKKYRSLIGGLDRIIK